MADTEAIKQAVAQAVVKAAKAVVFARNEESRRQKFIPSKLMHQRQPDTEKDLP